MTEDEMVGGITNSMDMSLSKLREFDGQRSLACCSPWGCKELDMTEQLNNNFHTIKYTQNNFSTSQIYLLPL